MAYDFSVPLRAEVGWEAAVFDHLQAVVTTICQRLRIASSVPKGMERIGGSTYTFDIWDDHPLAGEVEAALTRFRAAHSELRARVEAHNAKHGRPKRYRQVVVYGGQHVLERGAPGRAVEDDEKGND